jgi:hypothetical protein
MFKIDDEIEQPEIVRPRDSQSADFTGARWPGKLHCKGWVGSGLEELF